MNKDFLDKVSESYEKFHLEDSQIKNGEKSIVVSSKLKLILGWSLFLLCCIVAYVLVLNPSKKVKQRDPEVVAEEDVEINDEHKTIMPYEKDAYEDLNEFMQRYYDAVVRCDNIMLQKMVTDPSVYSSDEALKKKAEFITGYSDLTIYTKQSVEEGNFVVFVVSTVSISGVNSDFYDIQKFYVVNGERGYMINNGTLSQEVSDYIAKVTGDKDIQKIYQSVKEKNEKIQKKDPSIEEQFYNVINKENADASENTENTEAVGNPADTENAEAIENSEGAENTDEGQSDDESEDTVQ